jgi:hypothetical protein
MAEPLAAVGRHRRQENRHYTSPQSREAPAREVSSILAGTTL